MTYQAGRLVREVFRWINRLNFEIYFLPHVITELHLECLPRFFCHNSPLK